MEDVLECMLEVVVVGWPSQFLLLALVTLRPGDGFFVQAMVSSSRPASSRAKSDRLLSAEKIIFGVIVLHWLRRVLLWPGGAFLCAEFPTLRGLLPIPFEEQVGSVPVLHMVPVDRDERIVSGRLDLPQNPTLSLGGTA